MAGYISQSLEFIENSDRAQYTCWRPCVHIQTSSGIVRLTVRAFAMMFLNEDIFQSFSTFSIEKLQLYLP